MIHEFSLINLSLAFLQFLSKKFRAVHFPNTFYVLCRQIFTNFKSVLLLSGIFDCNNSNPLCIGQMAATHHELDWKFTQSFGEKDVGTEVTDGTSLCIIINLNKFTFLINFIQYLISIFFFKLLEIPRIYRRVF